MMKRKLLSLLAALGLLLSATAGPVAQNALAAWPVNGECDHFDVSHYFGNVFRGGGNLNNWPTAIYAEMYGDITRFQPCANPWGGEQSTVTQWIAFQSNDAPAGGNEILQVGYIICHGTNDPSCYDSNDVYHQNQLGYFWGWGRNGDCPAYPGDPSPPWGTWLGTVPNSGGGPVYHSFQLTRGRPPQYQYYVYIDGVIKAQINPDKICWANDTAHVAGSWAAERHDPNDGFGGVGYVWFQNSAIAYNYGSLGNPFFTTGTDSPTCDLDPEFHCSIPVNNKVGFITTQQ